MWRLVLILASAVAWGERGYEVRGTLVPATVAAVGLHGATRPYHQATRSGLDGRFRFKELEAGSYNLVIVVRGSGEVRKTIEVGPSTADKKGRVVLAVRLDEAKMTPDRSGVVSMKELGVSEKARRGYEEANRRLERGDVAGAERALLKAVEISPEFAAAWNHLGTIAYQTQRYEEAEKRFRRALEADGRAYEPLVNLGGVLVTLGRFSEAWTANVQAVTERPVDPLAQSQLGMTYLGLGKPELAEKHLLEAVRLDAGHFSHPQMLLAGIYIQRGEMGKAVGMMEDFLRHHPDWKDAQKMRKAIAEYKRNPGAE